MRILLSLLFLLFTLLLSSPAICQDDATQDDTDNQSEATDTETVQDSETESASDAEEEPAEEEWQVPDTFDELWEDFCVLTKKYNSEGITSFDPNLSDLKDKVSQFNNEKTPTEQTLAVEMQLVLWRGDRLPFPKTLLDHLEVNNPKNTGIRVAWVNQLKNNSKYSTALEVLDGEPIDLSQYPIAAVLRAECLVFENRFEEAEAVLDSIPSDAKRTPELLDRAYNVRSDFIDKFREDWQKEQEIRKKEEAANDLPQVNLITGRGAITLELFENEAPNTVANFISLVEEGFYTQMPFHSISPTMAIAGDPSRRQGADTVIAPGGLGYTINDELPEDNYRKHFNGVISMEKSRFQPNSGGSQFALLLRQLPYRDGQNTVFGRIVHGMRIARNLENGDKILEAKVLRKRSHEYAVEKIVDEEADISEESSDTATTEENDGD